MAWKAGDLSPRNRASREKQVTAGRAADRGDGTIRLVVVAPIRLYREGLAQLLCRKPGFLVVGTGSRSSNCLDLVREVTPDVVLSDFAMSGSLAAVRQVVDAHLHAQVIMLGVPETESDVIGCAEAGAVGYVTREATAEILIRTVVHTVRGELRCTPKMAAAFIKRLASVSGSKLQRQLMGILTARETQVGQFLKRGLSNKEIAAELSISHLTVKAHVSSILGKLHARRRTEAAAMLYDYGF